MPRYTAKCHVSQTTNVDTCRQFLEALYVVGIEAVVVSCPKYYYGKSYRQFEFQSPRENITCLLDLNSVGIFDVKRLWDKDDTCKVYYKLGG